MGSCWSGKKVGRGTGYHAALRQLATRLVGILHGCLKTGTIYDEHTAWDTTTNKINKLLLDNSTHGMSDNALDSAYACFTSVRRVARQGQGRTAESSM